MKIVIKNGRIIDPASQLDIVTDLCIEEGRISQIGSSKPFIADKIIDAKDHYVIPGLVDLCARPQLISSQLKALSLEGKAAIARGITSLCIPPDGESIVDTASIATRLRQLGGQSLPHVYPVGALTSQLEGKAIADLTSLADSGCVALTNAQKPIKNLRILRNCYDYAASFDLLVVIQPMDPWLSQDGVVHEGYLAMDLGLPGIPETAETIAIAQHLLLIEQSGVRAHFTCLSTARGVALIREAKAKGLNITADTAMHSLHLKEMDVGVFNANCHLYPPLRSEQDKQGLLAGLKDGTLDAICSDHRPLDSSAKLAPFADTLPGMSTFDTFLSLGLELVQQEKLALMTLIDRLTFQPAKILKLPIGSLSIGQNADICIFNPKKLWSVSEKTLISQGKNNAFLGRSLSGVVTHTFLNGHMVYGE